MSKSPVITCYMTRLGQDLVTGLDGVMFNDLMENIEWFFNLHDKNKDGFLSKDEVLTLSESFLVG
jgi:Ca2+-binding EF-hand superfamily protein